jgi:microcystin-dependent protein
VSEPYVAEIRVFGFNFAPVNWAFCNGSLVAITQNAALFNVIGTTYGGDGVNTFGLPNLQANLAVGAGSGLGLQTWVVGEIQGEANHTLTINEVPPHNHPASASGGVAFAAELAGPSANAYFGRERGGAYAATSNTTLAPQAIGQTGGNQPHNNSQPTLAMNYCLALFGVFPSQN